MVGLVMGERAAFCGPRCRDGFRADRLHGVTYPAVYYRVGEGRDGWRWRTWEAASLEGARCAYCAADVAPLREVAS